MIIISDNEYITSGKEGLLLKDVADDKTYVLLDHQKKVNTRHNFINYYTVGPSESLSFSYPLVTSPLSYPPSPPTPTLLIHQCLS